MSTAAYPRIIAAIFEAHYRSGDEEVAFERGELEETSTTLGIPRPKNLGDISQAASRVDPLDRPAGPGVDHPATR
jgi:hypothetical protein